MTSLSRLLCFSLILTGVVLVCVPGDAHAQSTDAKSKGTGSISGKVTLAGKAAAGIPIAVFGSDLNYRRAAAQATTDNEGHYRLLGLSAAQYRITALAPSLIPAEGNNNYPFYGAAKTVLLSAGESVEDVDLKLVRAAETDASFAIGNIAPGRYWIIARPADDGDPKKVKPIRQDSALRARVLREGETTKKEISIKPCERAADYDLPYSLPALLPSSPKP